MDKIVVIIPTFNEKENINKMIDVLEEDIFPGIKKATLSILVVDDKSPDGTADVVKEKMKKYTNLELSLGDKQGLGAAYMRGMKYAMNEMKADAVIEFDADFQHDPKYIPQLVEQFAVGFDHVIGSRGVAGGSVPNEWGIGRKFLTKFGGLFSRFVLFFPKVNVVKDTSTGLKLTKVHGILDKVDFSKISNGFFYKTQILFQLVNMKAKIKEIPLEFKLREVGQSKMTMKDIIGTFTAVIKLRLSDPNTIRIIKFGTVGFIGFVVNESFLFLFGNVMHFPEYLSWGFSTELAIISNFIWNNIWTFQDKQIKGNTVVGKFLQFNGTSLGALLIQTAVGAAGTYLLGEQYRLILLPFIIAFLVLPYNYFMYTHVIWKTKTKSNPAIAKA